MEGAHQRAKNGIDTGTRTARVGLEQDRLQLGDTFNIVRFDDTLEVLFPSVVAADAGNISTAKRFVASLDAEGGTNMVPALAAALKLDSQSNPAANAVRAAVPAIRPTTS